MKATKVVRYACPDCGDLHISEPEARACCGVIEPEDYYQCGECEEVYEDRDEAKECCK